MKTKLFLLASATLFGLSSCVKDSTDTIVKAYLEEEYAELSKHLDLPLEVDDYKITLPASLGGSQVFIDNKQATLGRVLFYDKRLSSNKEVNCATCHQAEKAFADNEQFSQGVTEERTSRNTLALGIFPSFNAYYGFGTTRMFWDNRAASVADQSAETMKNPVEMGNTDLGALANSLLEEEYYQILFKKAFPPNNYNHLSNEEKMLIALQEFVSSIGCFNTKFDKAFQQTQAITSDFTAHGFTVDENLGKKLFVENCSSCHNLAAGFSTSIVSANNGLDADYEDEGMGIISKVPEEMGVFKVPMLRNIALTAPYMHDGRFATLEAVVEHYNSGIKAHPNLHQSLKDGTGNPRKLNLSESEKAALVAFLHTLTDDTSLLHPRYSDPFKP